jgi:hypothetical protein
MSAAAVVWHQKRYEWTIVNGKLGTSSHCLLKYSIPAFNLSRWILAILRPFLVTKIIQTLINPDEVAMLKVSSVSPMCLIISLQKNI